MSATTGDPVQTLVFFSGIHQAMENMNEDLNRLKSMDPGKRLGVPDLNQQEHEETPSVGDSTQLSDQSAGFNGQKDSILSEGSAAQRFIAVFGDYAPSTPVIEYKAEIARERYNEVFPYAASAGSDCGTSIAGNSSRGSSTQHSKQSDGSGSTHDPIEVGSDGGTVFSFSSSGKDSFNESSPPKSDGRLRSDSLMSPPVR